MRKNNLVYIIIIAFLLGMIFQDHCWSRKIPDIILPDEVHPDLRETLDYITDILNNGRYSINVSSTAIVSTDKLDAGVPVLDDNGTTKKLIISNGTNNYYVNLTQL